MAIIIDFDEDTLRKDLEHKELSENVITSRLQEYKNHTLPAAKHYDDALLLQLVSLLKDQYECLSQSPEKLGRCRRGEAGANGRLLFASRLPVNKAARRSSSNSRTT